MDKHINDLKAKLAATITKVETSPDFLFQGRCIGYLAAKMIYAAGQEARFLDRTPYFSSKPGTTKSRSKRGGGFTM